MAGTDVATYMREREGMSAFALEDGVVYHTYSAYSRGVDAVWGMYPWLDRAPKGRNETGLWLRRRDEYPGEYVTRSTATLETPREIVSCCGHEGGAR